LESSIHLINQQISLSVGAKSTDISQVLCEIEHSNKVDLNLSGNVSYDAIMKGLIKYNFIDGEDYIPEDQFGLGYINLLNIIGEIIHFVDSYEDKSHFSKVNLLFIEEPEAFMHPHMQEFFIKRIDNAVKKALEIANNSSVIKKLFNAR
jgi:predicted ATP-dependent endonuclease of OLD family